MWYYICVMICKRFYTIHTHTLFTNLVLTILLHYITYILPNDTQKVYLYTPIHMPQATNKRRNPIPNLASLSFSSV